jgi:HK97 family phage portal protein
MGLLDVLRAERRQYLNPENPSTSLANPASWLVDVFASAPSRSGAVVDEKTALYNTAVMACIRVLSETIATLPLHIYRQSGANKTVDREHPVARLLDYPNPDMDAVQFRETMMGHVLAWGNAYAEIERDGAGRPVRLWILPPDRVTPQRRSDGSLFYIASFSGRSYVLNADQMFHLVGLGWDGILGYSPIRMHREAIGLSQATESFGSSWFGNGSRPSGVLTHPGALSQTAKENLKNSWDVAHSGLSNSQRVAVLEEGIKWEAIGIPPEDAQFLETRKFQVEEIARMYRVPLHLIQHMEKSTSWGTGVEELGQGFITYSLTPWLVRWEQRIGSRLIAERERSTIYAKHSLEGLLRGDSAKRADFYSKMMGIGALSVNDVLELEDRNPIPEGDARFVPLNWVPLNQAVAEDPEPVAQPVAEEGRMLSSGRRMTAAAEKRVLEARDLSRSAHLPLFVAAAERLNRWELAGLRAALKRAIETKNMQYLGDWVGDNVPAARAQASRQFGPVIGAYGRIVAQQMIDQFGPGSVPDDQLEEFLREYVDGLGARWTNQTLRTVRGRIAAGGQDTDGIVAELEDDFQRWDEGRSSEFANGELVQASGAVTKFAAGALGYLALRWVANPTACPACLGLNGRVVRKDQVFVGDGEAVGIGDHSFTSTRNIGHPPLHGGCSCDVVPV